MSSEKKTVLTPGAVIIAQHFNGAVAELELPFNHHYCILEGQALPPTLGYPKEWPRVYAVCGVDKSGSHVHRPNTEKEIMICLSGNSTVHLWDKNGTHLAFDLKPPQNNEKFKGLFVDAGVWHTVRYARDTVLLVAASTNYNRDDYIENPGDYFKDKSSLTSYHEVFDQLD